MPLSYTLSAIIQPQLIPSSAAAVAFAPTGAGAAVPANNVFRIITAHVTNIGAVAVPLTVWRVPSGQSNIAANNIIPVSVIVPVATNAYPQFDLTALWGATLMPGDAIWVQAGAANALIVYADGAVIQ